MKSSVSASNELAVRLAEFTKALRAACAEMASLKKPMVRTDTDKVDSRNIFVEVWEKLEQRIVCLNVSHISRSWAEKLRRFLLTESMNAVDAVVQHLGHEAMN